MSSPKQYTSKAKFQMVLEALREHEPQVEIARSFGVHPKLIGNWKKYILEHGHILFEHTTKQDEQSKKIAELETLIGRQTIELELAKRFLGHLGSRGRLP